MLTRMKTYYTPLSPSIKYTGTYERVVRFSEFKVYTSKLCIQSI